MYKLFITLRYLRSHKIIYFSVAGVMIGIMVLIIVTSVMGGFSRDIRERIRGMQSHLVVVPGRVPSFYHRENGESGYQDISQYIVDYQALMASAKKIPHVIGVAPRMSWSAWLGAHGTLISKGHQAVTFLGVDLSQEQTVSEIARYFQRGKKEKLNFQYDNGENMAHPGVVVGSELPYPIDKSINLITTRPLGGSFAYLDRAFEVVGEFKTGMSEYDSFLLYMSLRDAQDFLHLSHQYGFSKDVVNEVAIKLDDYSKAEEVRKAINNLFANNRNWFHLRVLTWEQVKATLLRAVSIEKNIQIVILFSIVIVAGFNIIAIFTLMVRSKVKDIGILRALGATRGGIRAIFLLAGFLCGTIGSLLGIAAGLGISYSLNSIAEFSRQHFGFDLFPKDVYYLESIPVEVDVRTIVFIVLSTMVVSLLFSIYPASRAAKFDPIEAIRYE